MLKKFLTQHPTLKKTSTFFCLLAVTLLLSSCTLHDDRVNTNDAAYNRVDNLRTGTIYQIPLTRIIQRFEPTKGTGANYAVGEDIQFSFLSQRSGYITLTAIDPDGFVYVLGRRNMYVRANELVSIPLAQDNVQFTAAPPRGLHYVRASFTSAPTDTTIVVYQDKRGKNIWTETIVNEVSTFPAEDRDIVETSLYIY